MKLFVWHTFKKRKRPLFRRINYRNSFLLFLKQEKYISLVLKTRELLFSCCKNKRNTVLLFLNKRNISLVVLLFVFFLFSCLNNNFSCLKINNAFNSSTQLIIQLFDSTHHSTLGLTQLNSSIIPSVIRLDSTQLRYNSCEALHFPSYRLLVGTKPCSGLHLKKVFSPSNFLFQWHTSTMVSVPSYSNSNNKH